MSHCLEEKAAIKTAPVSPAGAYIYCKWLLSEWEGAAEALAVSISHFCVIYSCEHAELRNHNEETTLDVHRH